MTRQEIYEGDGMSNELSGNAGTLPKVEKKWPPRVWVHKDLRDGFAAGLTSIEAQDYNYSGNRIEYLSLDEHNAYVDELSAKYDAQLYKQCGKLLGEIEDLQGALEKSSERIEDLINHAKGLDEIILAQGIEIEKLANRDEPPFLKKLTAINEEVRQLKKLHGDTKSGGTNGKDGIGWDSRGIDDNPAMDFWREKK